jgi:hypothetical protein
MEQLLDAIAALWRAEGMEPRGGADPAAIRAFEQLYDVVLPDDARAYFLRLNGLPDGYFDAEFTEFRPIERVQTVMEVRQDDEDEMLPQTVEYFCFADHGSRTYAVRLTRDGSGLSDVIYVHSGTDLIPIASSLAEFFLRYVGPERPFVLDPQFMKGGMRYGYRP